MKQSAVVKGALEELLLMGGNLVSSDSDTLEAWIDDLARELLEQREAVNEVVEELGERTEPLLVHVEERKVEGAYASGVETRASKSSYSFKNMTHMEPPLLLKEVRPAELRSWEVKFDSWLSCSLQGSPHSDFFVATFISKCDPWWDGGLIGCYLRNVSRPP